LLDDTSPAVVGHTAEADVSSVSPAELLSTPGVWGRRVRWCALRAQLDGAYPQDLQAIRAHDTSCLPWSTDTRVWVRDADSQLSYLTETVGGQQRFVIVGRAASGSVYFDSEGRWGPIGIGAPGRLPPAPAPANPSESPHASTAALPAGIEAAAEGDPAHNAAMALLRRDCDALDSGSCARLAHVILGTDDTFREISVADTARVTTRLRALCDSGGAGDCFLLGRVLSRRGTSQMDRQEAERLLFAACDAWPDYGCLQLAQLRLEREGAASPVTLEIAERGHCDAPFDRLQICEIVRADLTQRCDAGDPRTCLDLATGFMRGDLERRPPSEGWSAVQRACTLGDARACDMLRSVGVQP
jgi:hypothetical protein